LLLRRSGAVAEGEYINSKRYFSPPPSPK
jgi:hypothetical protein